jgi:hypothetical protein
MNELHLQHVDYNPDNLLDALIDRLKLKNDADLSRLLAFPPPVISKIRHRRLAVGAPVLLSMHEETGLSIKELRMLMGDRRDRFRSIPSQASGG